MRRRQRPPSSAERAGALGELAPLRLHGQRQLDAAGLPEVLPEPADQLVKQVPVGPAMGGEKRLLTGDEAREAVLDHRLEEIGLAPEVVHHQGRTHAGALADVGDGGALVTGLGEHLEGGRQDLGGPGLGASAPFAAFLGCFGDMRRATWPRDPIPLSIYITLQQDAQCNEQLPHRKWRLAQLNRTLLICSEERSR